MRYGYTVGKSSLFPPVHKSSIRGNATLGYTFVFGPVHSGRLGLSLGIDVLGDAVCTFDCTYCEVGRTTSLTCDRQPYVPAQHVLEELKHWKDEAVRLPDVVTLGGRGEPCLNSDMGAIIRGVKDIFPKIPVAVLTNSTLLTDPAVRRDLAEADVVLPSIDTLVPDEMRRLNRPHPSLDVAALREGLLAFAREYTGKLYVEVLLVQGVNDSDENRALLRQFLTELQPDRVDIVTMTRPGTLRAASPVPPETLALWRRELAPQHAGETTQRSTPSTAEGDNISTETGAAATHRRNLSETAVLELVLGSVSRRPQTARQLAEALVLPPADVRRALDALLQQGRIAAEDDGGEAFYGAFRD